LPLTIQTIDSRLAEINKDAHLVERRKVAPFGIYTLVCFERMVNSAA